MTFVAARPHATFPTPLPRDGTSVLHPFTRLIHSDVQLILDSSCPEVTAARSTCHACTDRPTAPAIDVRIAERARVSSISPPVVVNRRRSDAWTVVPLPDGCSNSPYDSEGAQVAAVHPSGSSIRRVHHAVTVNGDSATCRCSRHLPDAVRTTSASRICPDVQLTLTLRAQRRMC